MQKHQQQQLQQQQQQQQHVQQTTTIKTATTTTATDVHKIYDLSFGKNRIFVRPTFVPFVTLKLINREKLPRCYPSTYTTRRHCSAHAPHTARGLHLAREQVQNFS